MANELRLSGLNVSPTGVRGVWLRHDIETRFKRLLRLEASARETAIALSEPPRVCRRLGFEGHAAAAWISSWL